MSDAVIEQWARPTDPPTTHPATKFGAKAVAAGWDVDYRYARGPSTAKRRPSTPNEQGKYALIEVTQIVDSIAVRARHPDGRRLAGVWVEGKFDSPGFAASPRTGLQLLGIRDLTKYLTETEEETVDEEPLSWEGVKEEAMERYIAMGDERDYTIDSGECVNAWVEGYAAGHAAADEKAGNAYGEGYAAGLAAVSGRTQVWAKTRRRLSALRPGDVILGKGDRWFIVTDAATVGRDTRVRAVSNGGDVEVLGHPSRMVEVVEEIATADALAALKAEGIEPERVT